MRSMTLALLASATCAWLTACSTLEAPTAELPAIHPTLSTGAQESMATPSTSATSAPSELVIKEVKPGAGAAIAQGATAVVQYTGWLYDPSAPNHKGAKFDSSRDRNKPFSFSLGTGEVIAGWDKGVEGMKVGGARELVIPPGDAYGARGAGGVIPPNATLVFDVELVGIKEKRRSPAP